LAGLCQTHIDPYGYIEGAIIPEENKMLTFTGDMVATMMAWLSNVPAGGGTAFDTIGHEMMVKPVQGSVAFWYGLDAKGHRLRESSHGGCPILMGSKWILNKWIYVFNQWQNYPCNLSTNAQLEPFKSYF
jgi:hypothetical protein